MPEISVTNPLNKNSPSSFDYVTTSKCDDIDCDGIEPQEGIMYHARGATGRICEVLFLCHKHAFPTSEPKELSRG